MSIAVLPLRSPQFPEKSLDNLVKQVRKILGKSGPVEVWSTPQEKSTGPIVVLFASGGTETLFRKAWPILKGAGHPLTLVSLPTNNSLPSVLEVNAWLRTKSGSQGVAHLHGSIADLGTSLPRRLRLLELAKGLRQERVGLIGTPSDWLVASQPDPRSLTKRWGVQLKEIDLAEIAEEAREATPAQLKKAMTLIPGAIRDKTKRSEALLSSLRVFVALETVIKRYQLTCFTIRCFDLLHTLRTSGCIALSLLNDRGFPSGCEGDLPALWTMLLNHRLTGAPTFMANPADIKFGEILFAHCTIPMSLGKHITLPTHFESNLGVAVSARLPPGPVTISRLGGKGLGHLFVAEGTIVPAEPREGCCRTQVQVVVPTGWQTILTHPLGNHHVLSAGNHASELTELCQLFGVVPVV